MTAFPRNYQGALKGSSTADVTRKFRGIYFNTSSVASKIMLNAQQILILNEQDFARRMKRNAMRNEVVNAYQTFSKMYVNKKGKLTKTYLKSIR